MLKFRKEKPPEKSTRMLIIPGYELQAETHLPSYQICPRTAMNSYKWNNSRVTVREGSRVVLARELEVLSGVSHPQLLLMMGHTEDLRIVFEPVLLGSLYFCLHQNNMKVVLTDVCLQVTEALIYLYDRDLVHGSVSSHAVQMLTPGIARLGMLERTVEEGDQVQQPPQTLYNWTSPEIFTSINSGQPLVAMIENDVFSLCSLIWELVHTNVPWRHSSPDKILSLVCRGYTLKLEKNRIPRLLYRVLRQGLIWNMDMRDLELGEIRDMLLMSRSQAEDDHRDMMVTVSDDHEAPVTRDRSLVSPLVRLRDTALTQFSGSVIQSDIHKMSASERLQQVKDDAETSRERVSSNQLPSLGICASSKRQDSVEAMKKSASRSFVSNKNKVFMSKYSSLGNGIGEQTKSEGVEKSKFKLLKSAFPVKPSTKARDPDKLDFPQKFDATRKYFEDKEAAAESMNVSSGELYKTALESPDNSRNLDKEADPGGRKVGTYMKLWHNSEDVKNGNVGVVSRSSSMNPDPESSPANVKEPEKLPEKGFVKNAVHFFQDLDFPPFVTALGSNSPAAYSQTPKTRNQMIQTDNILPRSNSRFVAESTPIMDNLNKKIKSPPAMSPLSCSPMFPNRKSQLIRKQKMMEDESFICQGSQSVDFSIADGRQKMFTTALSRATITSPASTTTSRDPVSSPYQTCLDENDITNNNVSFSELSSDNKRQAVVTFNSSVEEITTSIVSVMTDSQSRQSPTNDDFETLDNENTEDNYIDDDLSQDNKEEPINMQLMEEEEDNIDWSTPGHRLDTGDWRVGDECSGLNPDDDCWYPCTISVLHQHEAAVIFSHNQQLLTVPLINLKHINDDQTNTTDYQTVVENQEDAPVDDEDNQEVSEVVDDGDDEAGYKSAVSLHTWAAGDQCVALWDEDGLWYRAVVEGVEGDTAVVTFTDYGNSAYCHIKNIVDKGRQITEDGQLVDGEGDKDESQIKENDVNEDDNDDEWN